MSVLTTVLLVVGAFLGVAVAGAAYSRRWHVSLGPLPAALRIISASFAIVVAAFLLPSAWREADRLGALVVLLVPVLSALAAVSTDIVKRGRAVVTTLASAVMVFWSLLNGLSPAFLFILPAVVMVAAAATSWFQLQSTSALSRGGSRFPA